VVTDGGEVRADGAADGRGSEGVRERAERGEEDEADGARGNRGDAGGREEEDGREKDDEEEQGERDEEAADGTGFRAVRSGAALEVPGCRAADRGRERQEDEDERRDRADDRVQERVTRGVRRPQFDNPTLIASGAASAVALAVESRWRSLGPEARRSSAVGPCSGDAG
jgi:hypothetical protein